MQPVNNNVLPLAALGGGGVGCSPGQDVHTPAHNTVTQSTSRKSMLGSPCYGGER